MQPIYIACPDPNLSPFTTPLQMGGGGLGVQWWWTTGLYFGFNFTLGI